MGRLAPPDIVPASAAYAPHPQFGHLFAPILGPGANASLAPPLLIGGPGVTHRS